VSADQGSAYGARLATKPANALLNCLYSLTEIECRRQAFDARSASPRVSEPGPADGLHDLFEGHPYSIDMQVVTDANG
jgi:hypothetical protein